MVSGPNTHGSLEKFLKDQDTRLTLVERRIAVSGGGGGGTPTTIRNTGETWQVPIGSALPADTLWADGSAVSRTTYAELFAVIGTTYGVGDGSTTFNLPNLNGRELRVPASAPLARWNISDVFRGLAGANPSELGDTYEIRASFTQLSTAMLPRMRFSTGGVDNTAASFQFSRMWVNTTQIQRATNTNVNMVYLGAAQAGRHTIQMMVQRPNSTDYTDFQWEYTERNTTESPMLMSGTGWFAANAAFDGITFFNEGGPMAGFMQVIPFGGSMVPSVIAARPLTATLFGSDGGGGSGGVSAFLGYAESTSGTTNMPGSGYGQVPGVQVDFALGAITKVHIEAQVNTYSSAAADVVQFELRDGSTTIASWTRMPNSSTLTTGTTAAQNFDTVLALAAGTHSLTLWAARVVGTGTVTVSATAFAKTFLLATLPEGVLPTTPGPTQPTQLWQEFTLAKPGGLRPLNSGLIVWDGAVTGTLGATLDATKRLITVPSAGTYRVVRNLGLAANPGVGTSTASYVDNVQQPKSLEYGNSGAAGVYVAASEFYFTTTAPAVLSIEAVAPLGLYDWTWLRIEKVEPFFPQSALTVNQGSTAQRDAIYGVPSTDAAKASLANRLVTWFNTDKGWFEIYYAVSGTAGLTAKGLATGFPAGWYPAAGTNIWGTCMMLSDQSVASGEVRINLNTGELVGGISTGNNVMIIPVGGIYEVSGHLYQWSTAGTYRGVQAFNVSDGTVHFSGTTSANWDITGVPRRSRIAAGVQIGLRTSGDAANTMRGQSWPALEIKYIGPPLATG